jgi:hypothetical protein
MTLEELLKQGKSFGQGASNAAASAVTGPVDMLAWALRKSGLPVGESPIGGEQWMRDKGFMVTPEKRMAGLLGEGFGMAAPIVAAAKAPQIAGGLLKMGDNLAAPVTQNKQLGAIVYHGSPHKFDKFDSSKIGTGEGAQAYGHGLYLAENPKVATEYSKMGTGAGGQIPSPLRFVNGQEVQPGTGAYKAADLLDNMTIPQARKMVNGWIKTARPEEAAYFQDVANTLSTITSKSAVKQKMPGGSLYKVDLPDEHIAKMLDWDKPLSQQHPDVQKAFNLSKYPPDSRIHNMTGMETYVNYGKRFGKPTSSTPETARAFRDLGIPGIRYLDGSSRGAGAGTSNYVVFPGNEGLLNIVERNGEPVKKLADIMRKK